MCASQFTHEENAIYMISSYLELHTWAEPIFLNLKNEMAVLSYVETCVATFFS